MNAVLLPLILMVVPALVLGVVVLVLLPGRVTPDSRLEPTVADARRHAIQGAVLAWVGVAASFLVLVPAVRLATGGVRGAIAAMPSMIALAGVGVLMATEKTWPRPNAAVRRARLNARTVTGVTPRPLLNGFLAVLGGLAATVVAGGLLASPDQHSITRRGEVWIDGQLAPTVSVRGPFPGLVYGIPAAIGVLVLALATYAALRLVVNRPAVHGADPETDDALRRAGAHRILRFAVLGGLATLAPLWYIAGGCLWGLNTAADAGLHRLAPVLMVGALGMVIAGIVVAVWPARTVPLPAEPRPFPGMAQA